MLKITDEQFIEQQKLCAELPLIMHRIADAGLFATMHKMHEVVREVGYEHERLLKDRMKEGKNG